MHHGSTIRAIVASSVMVLVLAGGGRAFPAAYAQTSLVDTALERFQDLAKDQLYEGLDEKFSDITGVNVIEKTTKMLEVIETLSQIEDFFEGVIFARESDKANLAFLQNLSGFLSTTASVAGSVPVAGSLISQFFTFYAEGVNAAHDRLQALRVGLRDQAIQIAELADLDFSIRPGAITDEELRAIRLMNAQEALSRRALQTVAAKKKRLEEKRSAISFFVNIDYPGFINLFVGDTQFLVDQEGGSDFLLDQDVRELRQDNRRVFEVTTPRDALEAQYSNELASLLLLAKDAVATVRVFRSILDEASATLNTANRQLQQVGFIQNRKSDAAVKSQISAVQTEIGRLRALTFTSTEKVETHAGALVRFRQITDGYAGVASDARQALTQAQAALTAAKAYVADVVGDFNGTGAVGVPYRAIALEFPAQLSADDVSQAVLGSPRSAEVRIGFLTAVQETVLVEIDGVQQTRIRFSQGALRTTASLRIEPSGIVSISAGQIAGLSAGKATVTAFNQGFLGAPIFDFLYTPEQFDALPRGEIAIGRTVEVFKFMELDIVPRDRFSQFGYKGVHKLRPLEVDLFAPANRGDWVGDHDENQTQLILKFERPPVSGSTTITIEADERNMSRTSSASDVAYMVAKNRFNNRNVLMAGKPGTTVITLGVINPLGVQVHQEELVASFNEVRVLVNNFSREGISHLSRGQEAWVHAGQVAELKVEIDGKADMSGYEVHWIRMWDLPGKQPELESAVTFFSGRSSTNRLRVPVDIEPNNPPRFDLEIRIHPRGDTTSQPVFKTLAPGIATVKARLDRTELFLRLAPNEPLRKLTELHQFVSPLNRPTLSDPGLKVSDIEIAPGALFRDEPNNRSTTGVFAGDTVSEFLNHTEVIFDPDVVSVTRKFAETGQIGFRFVAPIQPNRFDPLTTGASFVLTLSFPKPLLTREDAGAPLFGDGPKVSNATRVFVDPLTLEGPTERRVVRGGTEILEVTVPSQGDLTGYEVVWSLSPGVGGLAAPRTDFVRRPDGAWRSVVAWNVPESADGQSVTVAAAVHLKGVDKELGRDATLATIGAPLPPAITGIAPSIGSTGTSIAATISGTALLGATAVTFSGTGVTAAIASGGTSTSISVTITIAADASEGQRTVTVTAATGTSQAFTGFTVIAIPIRVPTIPIGPFLEKWADTTFPILWRLNPAKGVNITGSREPAEVVRLGFGAWSGRTTARVSFLEGATTTVTDAAFDGINLISLMPTQYSSDAQSLTVIYSFSGTGVDQFGRTIEFPGQIREADILFNPATPFSTDLVTPVDKIDLQSRATHEIGHVLGLDHSGLLSAVMSPTLVSGASHLRTLTRDDVIRVSTMYPNSSFFSSGGTIRGVVRSATDSPVYGAQVVIVDSSGRPVASTISDLDATYQVSGLEPGIYSAYAEPLDGPLIPSAMPSLGRINPGKTAPDNFATRFAKASAPTTVFTLTKTAGDNQQGAVGQLLPVLLEVLVQNAAGNPVQGVLVSFAPTGGGGTVLPIHVSTDAQGKARALAFLGTGKTQTFAASVATATVTFTATLP